MKKIIFALSAIAVLLTACSKDFINPKHNSSEPLDEYFNTPERLFQCLVAAYKVPHYNHFFSSAVLSPHLGPCTKAGCVLPMFKP